MLGWDNGPPPISAPRPHRSLLAIIRPQREVELILLAYLSLPNKVPKKYARWLCRANESPGLQKAQNQFQQTKICLLLFCALEVLSYDNFEKKNWIRVINHFYS